VLPEAACAVSYTRWVERDMTSIRIAIASLLAAGAVLAGGAVAHNDAAVSAGHRIVVADPIPCCFDVMTR
jgi:hypothetical protein